MFLIPSCESRRIRLWTANSRFVLDTGSPVAKAFVYSYRHAAGSVGLSCWCKTSVYSSSFDDLLLIIILTAEIHNQLRIAKGHEAKLAIQIAGSSIG
jgi:hypothetical protein